MAVGYAGYYLCRSDLSVAMPLLIREMASGGVSPDAAKVQLGGHRLSGRSGLCHRQVPERLAG